MTRAFQSPRSRSPASTTLASLHGPLSWPWVPDATALDTPARRWGVATALPNVLTCGAGALRGGMVTGVAGHNAAMALLETVRR